jgi:UDP-glucose 4-epimerase
MPMIDDAVLVVGSGGFIGRALVEALSRRGLPTIALSRSPQAISHPLVEVATYSEGASAELSALLERSRVVVHLATGSTPGTSAARPLAEVAGNLHFTATLLEALQQRPGVGLLYVSSGGSIYTDTSQAPSAEDAPVRPHSYHGAGKLAAEYFISAWCDQFSGSAVAVRPSNVYGPGQPERPGFGVIPAAMGAVLRNECLHVWGDGSARRDYIYVEDFLDLCLAILGTPMQTGLLRVNACSGASTSLDQLFATLEAVSGRTLLRTYDHRRSVDASCIAMSPALAGSVYGWHSKTALEEGVRRTWLWRQSLHDRGQRGTAS